MSAAAELVRRWAELYSDGTPDSYGTERYLQLYAEDVDWKEAPSSWNPQGRAGGLRAIREATASGSRLFRDRRVAVDEVIEDGDRAVWIGTWTATVGIDGYQFPAGTTVHVPMAMLIEVRNGRIVRQRDFPTTAVVSQ